MPKLFPPLKLKATASKLLDIFQFRRYSSSSTPSLSVPSHQHIAHLILDQNSATKALQTFKWASNLPKFTHSQSTYRALIQKLCAFHRFDTVYQLLDEMPHAIGSPPDEEIFLTVIRGLGRARMIPHVIKVLDLISKFGKNPSLKIFNSILDVLVKVDIDVAREFYRKQMMGSGVQGDDYTFAILMKGLCLTNRIGDGFRLLQVMKSRGVKPNAVVYNTLLHALCKNGKVGRARSLMDEIEEPNDVTFNVLIAAYCKEENLVQALVLLEKSFSLGFVPDVVTMTKVVEILCNAGRVTEAVEMLERVEYKGGLVDVVAYNTLLRGFCRLGKIKVAHRFLKEMERKGCLPNVETYNILISGFCDSGMFDMALDMFNDMKTDGISWNFDTYDTLIKGLFFGGRIEEGLKILELMEESKGGSGGRISPYNSVLYGLYKKNMWDEALEFLMKMEKLFPRAVDRSLRILGFCEKGAVKNAKMVFDQMINEGGTPNILVYDCLVHGFCQEGNLREAFELMNEMVGHGYFLVASGFNALIHGFCGQGKDESALKLLDDMVGRGCVPDRGTYSPLIDALCRKGNFQKALSIFNQMIEKGITPDSSTWNSLLIRLSKEIIWLENKNVFHVNKQLEWIIKP
ncbi:pentatricopeptide repeat-containing protein, putative [Ricinus communis]|uniref:Pentatricopeptide repeat-containing protein, putative n=1 Tax=Ricinus communis TaxID=3988 RepID=B9S6W0_RICCO|nr:pentatricopeptide repeat-containing protein, putative [Ricinus communis]|eukprot:XP_015576344.1 pentatricopeptide repeat-containing protein At2g17525, mitochondrial isoform X1 [Ricinus communis]